MKKPVSRSTPRGGRSNPVRQALYAGIAMAVVLAGYTAWSWRGDAPEALPPTTAGDGASKPWYQNQGPPPKLVNVPDQPLLAEPDAQAPAPVSAEPLAPLAYEEALPDEVYAPPPRPRIVFDAVDSPVPTSVPAPEIAPGRETAAIMGEETREAAVQVAWMRHAVPVAPRSDDTPMIAVVIDDMGVDRKRSLRIVDLPPPLTVSYLTYAEQLEDQAAVARAAGHELMVHVAMEPSSSKVDPGPHVLLTRHDAAEVRRRLKVGLDRLPGAVGINNHMGSKFTEDAQGMAVVLDELKRRGLMFLDSRTSAKSVAARLAHEIGVPVVERNVFLDNVNEKAAVLKRLAEAERLAVRRGFAIVIGHPRDGTIQALREWLPQAQAHGVRVVPLSAVLKASLAAGKS